MLKLLLRLAVSLSLIGLLVYFMRGELPAIGRTLAEANPAFITAAIAVHIAAVLVQAKRLELIYAIQETPLPLRETVNLTYVGYLFNNFLPTSVGGDVVKAYCGGRLTGQKLKSFTAVLMDRICGLLMFVLVPSVTLLFLLKRLDATVSITVYAALAFALLCLAFLFNRGFARKFSFLVGVLNRFRLGDKLRMLYDGLHEFKTHKKTMGQAFVLSLAAQLMGILAVYLFILALGSDIDVLRLLLLVPVVHLMSMLPSINGLGLRETGFVYFFKDSLGAHNATALAILYLFLLFVLSLIGGVIYLVRQDYHFRLKEVTA